MPSMFEGSRDVAVSNDGSAELKVASARASAALAATTAAPPAMRPPRRIARIHASGSNAARRTATSRAITSPSFYPLRILIHLQGVVKRPKKTAGGLCPPADSFGPKVPSEHGSPRATRSQPLTDRAKCVALRIGTKIQLIN